MFPFVDVKTFLEWAVVGPGPWLLSGAVMSLLASNFKKWALLPNAVKASVPVILGVAFAYVAKELLDVPAIVENADLNFMFQAVLYYLATQWEYGKVEKKQEALRIAALQEMGKK